MARASASKNKTQEPPKKSKAQSTSRGKKPTSSSKNETDPSLLLQGLSDAQRLALFTSMRKEMTSKKRTIDESEDQAVREANAALMQHEGDGDSEDGTEDGDISSAPPKKRQRPAALSDNEKELAKSLAPIIKTNNRNNQDPDSEPEVEEHHESELEKGADYDHDVDIDLTEETDSQNVDASRAKGWNNPILVEDKEDLKSIASRARSSYSHSSRSATPGLYPSKSTKVTEGHFPPDIRELAIVAKTHARTITAHETPFPPNDQNGRLVFAWKVVTEAAKHSGSNKLNIAVTRASNMTDIKRDLMIFTMYGRTALISSIIGRARAVVKSHYGLQGSVEEISSDVKWLLEKAHFIFSDLNLKDRTFNKCKPFLNSLIIDIIENQWTPSSSCAKSDSEATARIVKEENIPSTMILLVAAAIEHALKEWVDGQKPVGHVHFSDESARQSYMCHLDSWNETAKNTRVYVTYCQKTIYRTIMKRHQAFMDARGDIEELDFLEMDRIAQEQMEADD